MQAGFRRIAPADICRLQVEPVGCQPALIATVDGTDAADRGHEAGVAGRPAQSVLRDDRVAGERTAVAFPSRSKRDDQRIGGLRSVHTAPARTAMVLVFQRTRAHTKFKLAAL